MKLYSRPQIQKPEKSIKKGLIWKDDLFHRADCANLLTDLLEDGEDSVVAAVNGVWGSGKTFFLKRWLRSLEQHNILAVYIDAWADDFCEDPLVPILARMQDAFKQAGCSDSLMGSVSENAGHLLKDIPLAILSGLFKKATGVDADVIDKKFFETASENALERFSKLTRYRDALRQHLSELAKDHYSSKGRMLVVVIDELDRCAPSYAVRLLERIKHVLSVPHIVFVLGIDKTQLAQTLQAYYGAIDVENYLHRFIDLEFTLPEPDTTTYINSLWKSYQIEDYYKSIDERKYFLTPMRRVRKMLAYLCKMHRMSLRAVENVFKNFILVFRANIKSNRLHPELVAGLIILKFVSRDVYEEWMAGRCSVVELLDTLIPVDNVVNFPDADDLAAAFYAVHSEQVSLVALATKKFLMVIEGRDVAAADYHGECPRFMKEYSSKRLKSFAKTVRNVAKGSDRVRGCSWVELNHIAKCIEFVAGDYGNHLGVPAGVAVVSGRKR